MPPARPAVWQQMRREGQIETDTNQTGKVPSSPACDNLIAALRPLLPHDPLLACSRKVSANGVSDRRFLLTFPRAALSTPDDHRALAQAIGLPLPDALSRHWTRAEMIHLGLDAADTTGESLLKIYLEFAPESTPEPGLAYLALKMGLQARLNRYDWQQDPAPLLAQLALPPDLERTARQIADMAQNLRVSEAGSARLSLDMSLADLTPNPAYDGALAKLVAGVNPAAAPPMLWPSHVAIGRDRIGTAFVTLYGWPDGVMP